MRTSVSVNKRIYLSLCSFIIACYRADYGDVERMASPTNNPLRDILTNDDGLRMHLYYKQWVNGADRPKIEYGVDWCKEAGEDTKVSIEGPGFAHDTNKGKLAKAADDCRDVAYWLRGD